MGMASANTASPVARSFSRPGTRAVCSKARDFARIEQITKNPAASSRPGKTPAMNMRITLTFASCAYTTMGMEGGMIGPSSAPAAITAAAKPSP